MMKVLVLTVATFTCVLASHSGFHSHLVAAPSVVTAQSSQVFTRNYNGIVPFAPAVIAARFAPAVVAAPVPRCHPHRVVSPFYPSRVVAPFGAYAPHAHPFYPYPRPLLY